MYKFFQPLSYAALFCATTLAFPALAQTPDASGNFIANGNFETDADANGSPDNWGTIEPGKSWENEDGNRFYRLKTIEPGKSSSLHWSQAVPEGVRAFELSWRQRVSDLKVGSKAWYDARVIVNFKDATGQAVKGGPNPVYTNRNTAGWQIKNIKFLVPDGAKSVELMPMLYQAQSGTFDLDDIVLKATDPAPLLELQAKNELLKKFLTVVPEAPNKAKWPSELRVIGTKVLDKSNKEVLLRGVNVPSLEWTPRGENVLRSIMVAVDDWKSNVIRLPVKSEFWFGKGYGAHEAQGDGGVAYRKLVDDAITMAANRGAYIILDLHSYRAVRSVYGDFWKEAATKYKDHPAVLFDLLNEPHSTSWEIWKSGGFVEDKTAPADEDAFLTPEDRALNAKGFRSIGMQKLADIVRGTGAKNVLVVGGLDWAYDLSGLAKGFTLDDKGGNGIILSTHIYPFKRDWPGKVLVMADKYPILVGEFGANTEKFTFVPAASQEDAATWVPKIFGFMQKHNFHYTGWSFHPGAGPKMLKGWDYEPTPEWGAVAKRVLAGEQFPYTGMR